MAKVRFVPSSPVNITVQPPLPSTYKAPSHTNIGVQKSLPDIYKSNYDITDHQKKGKSAVKIAGRLAIGAIMAALTGGALF